MSPDELYQHLKYISNILEESYIKHWILYGTLLGAIRNHDIIPYDYDFDIGANVGDVDKIMNLNSHVANSGYQFKKKYIHGYAANKDESEPVIWKVSIKIVYKKEEVGDIYLYHNFSDGFMRRFDPKTGTYFWAKGTIPSWFTNRLVYVKIRDTNLPAPRDPEILLKQWYGPDWMTPIKAQAQGGKSRVGYDYYGGYTDTKLSTLITYIGNQYGIFLKPNINLKIKYYFPESDKTWIKTNEKYLLR
jgi:phosphorylcholine metabolism protein LicD